MPVKISTSSLNLIKQLQARLEKEITALDFNKKPVELYEPITYTLSLGGKRMRPLLLLLGNELFDGNVDKAMPAALAIEVFHNFTLLHDDIMDQAPLRRNQPTVHAKWNVNIALLSGDVMMVFAYKLLNRCDREKLPEILHIFNETAVHICEGQQYDMAFEQQEDVSISEYMNMISLKTAALLAGSIQIGAVLAGAQEEDAANLFRFGEELGIAFQLQDDILDAFGEPEKFGKQVGGDIIANKKTFLLLKALELADEKTRSQLQQLLLLQDKEQKVRAVLDIYEQLEVRQIAQQMMQAHYQNALEALERIRVKTEKKQVLIGLADRMMVREI